MSKETMRTVVRTEEGVLELNYMWLPTWIGMNAALKRDLERKLSDKIVGMTMDSKSLDAIDEMVITELLGQFPGIVGLRPLLEALRCVELS